MDKNEIQMIKRREWVQEAKDWAFIVALAIALSFILAGCGSGSGDSVVTQDPIAESDPPVIDPVDNAPEPVEPESAVDPVVSPVVSAPDPVEPNPPVVPDPVVVVPPVVPVPVVQPPEPVEIIEEPVELPVLVQPANATVTPEPEPTIADQTAYYLVVDTIQDYLDGQARALIEEFNASYFDDLLTLDQGLCLSNITDVPKIAQTTLNCPTPYSTRLGTLSSATLIRTNECVASLEELYDSSPCIIESTYQTINGEYEISRIRTIPRQVVYLGIAVLAPEEGATDFCNASYDLGPSEGCDAILLDIVSIIEE